MRRIILAATSAALIFLSVPFVASHATADDVRPTPAHAAPASLSQTLPPGAVKHPGEKCATTVQPPEYQACPGPPDDVIPDGTRTGHPWCVGEPLAIGECRAAEAGFFNPPANMRPRNQTEACIAQRESGDSYYPNPPGNNGQRWQFLAGTWRSNGGQDDHGFATPAEQDHVFADTVAAQGYAPWRSFDGC